MDTSANHRIEELILNQVTSLFKQLSFEAEKATPRGEFESVQPLFQLKDFHQPIIKAGTYEVKASQQVVNPNDASTTLEGDFKSELTFVIPFPEKKLIPADVHTVFPPHGSFGDYANYLPHIIINRSTFPWEENHYTSRDNVPWLALIVLDGTAATQKDKFITVDPSLIPTEADLIQLAHVIKRQDGTEKAVLIANRLPQSGANHVAHVIALDEQRNDGKYPSLYSWDFSCESPKSTFLGLVKALDKDVLRLPQSAKDSLNQALMQGYVPLPHTNRNGQKLMSWYRGPLIPLPAKRKEETHHIYTSDQLLRYFKRSKRIDVSYASAWELGKWLTLEQKEISIAMYRWKKQLAITQKAKLIKRTNHEIEDYEALQKVEAALERLFRKKTGSTTIPDAVVQWLKELTLLKPIPFANLVPHEQLLPEESIRFFHIDEGWIWALIDGALSIGRQLTNEESQGSAVSQLNFSGCLMRSKVVNDFPDLQITANGKKPIELRRIGNGILLCIFVNEAGATAIDQVEVFLNASGMHFGVSKTETAGKFIKYFNYDKGEEKDNTGHDVPFRGSLNARVIDIHELAGKIQVGGEPSSGLFAFRMIESAPRVTFKWER
ncbi:MAG: hypothetical protein ACPGJS_22510 [Flammeovirgaceae bacterium]